MPNMKETELRKNSQCIACKKFIGELTLPIFWVVNAEKHVVNFKAIQRQAGLEAMLGSVGLARVMGADEDMTKVLGVTKHNHMVCDSCMLERFPEFHKEVEIKNDSKDNAKSGRMICDECKHENYHKMDNCPNCGYKF